MIKFDGLVLYYKGIPAKIGDIFVDSRGIEYVIRGLSRGRLSPKVVVEPINNLGIPREMFASVFPDVTFKEVGD